MEMLLLVNHDILRDIPNNVIVNDGPIGHVGQIGPTGYVPDGCGYGNYLHGPIGVIGNSTWENHEHWPRGPQGITGPTSCCSGGGQGYSGSAMAEEKISKIKTRCIRKQPSIYRPIPRHQKRMVDRGRRYGSFRT